MFSFSNLSKILPAALLALSSISGLAQTGNQGGIRTTNLPFAGAVLVTDGTIYYWGTPTNLQASVTNAQPPSTVLTNLSATGVAPGATNASAYIGSSSGLGTNTDIKVTLEVFGSATVSTNLIVTNNFTAKGAATNENGLAVHNDPIIVSSTNFAEGAELRMTTYDDLAGSFILMRHSRGTVAAPTRLLAGDLVGDIDVAGMGDGSVFRRSFMLEAFAMSDFVSSGESLVNLRIGDTSGGAAPVKWTWTAYNSTNDANLWIKSNATVSGSLTVNGVQTNHGGVYVDSGIVGGHAEVFIQNTNNSFWAQLYIKDIGDGNANLYLDNANGTAVAQSGLLSGESIANIFELGRGSTQSRVGFAIRSYALNNWTDSDGRALVLFHVGDNTADLEGKIAIGLTAFNKTNNVNVVNNSNITVVGTSTLTGGITEGSTNVIHALTEDATPALGDFVMTEDLSSGLLKKVQISNITGAGSGEVNVNGEVSVTNATKIGLVYGKTGVTNLLRSVEAGDGLSSTNQGTNVIFAAGAGLQRSSMVLSNLVGTVANNVTNENSSALQINSGTMTLTPGVLSNVVASGHGAPYIAVNTNSGTLANITNLVFRTPNVTVSNDSSGIASIHVASTGGSGDTNNVVTGQHFTTVSNQLYRAPMVMGDPTNIVFSFRTNVYIVAPSNVFTATFTDLPQSGHKATIEVFLINTNASAGYFQTNGLNGGSVILLSSPSTNRFLIHSQTNALWVESGQILATGISDIFVMATNAVISTATNVNPTIQDAGGVKFTFDLGSPSAGQGLVFHSATVVTNDTVGGSGEINVNGEVSVTNATRFGLVHSKSGVTNLLRSIEPIEHLGGVNQGTNLAIRITSPVLTNLTGVAASTVTNENSAALQINTGTLTLTPGVLSNLVANTIDVPGTGNIVSNVNNVKFWTWTNYVQTVSNFVFSFNTNRYELKNQTNVVFTNIVEEATAVSTDIAVHIHNTTGVTMGLVWPAYGAQHGYFFQTNANNPILSTTTLSSGQHGIASFTAYGTNIFATFTTWP